ncbi:MAG: hypothetical protein DHS20C18_04910 [Saprospiraceae bacterium]|nr:MAG: hypothetical protein DHS20C18_04910 [Saprospiraceae bacterium]
MRNNTSVLEKTLRILNRKMSSSPLLMILSILILCAACEKFKSPTQEVPETVTQYFKYLGPLPNQLNEISGLVIEDSTIWAHNDSGDGPYLYQVSLSGDKLLRKATIKGIFPIDWEDMTRDEHFFYLGDFGNNNGNRQDLSIYKVAIDSLDLSPNEKISFHSHLTFSYEDQLRFNYGPYQHNFDCEAMIVQRDSLYLFTKNHEDNHCRFYALSKHSDGSAIAQLRDTFDTKGTITAAAYTVGKTGPVLALLGYNYKGGNAFHSFLWLFTEFKGANFFSGKQQRIDLPPIAQTEGISFLTPTKLLISSEAENLSFGKLFQFDIEHWLQ